MNIQKLKSSIIIPVLYMFFIFILSSIPADKNDKLGGVFYIKPTLQNILHVPLYGLLAFLWLQFFICKGKTSKNAVVFTIVITILYAAFDELHQYFIPGRYASLSDFIFNAIGCLIGVFIYRLRLVSNLV